NPSKRRPCFVTGKQNRANNPPTRAIFPGTFKPMSKAISNSNRSIPHCCIRFLSLRQVAGRPSRASFKGRLLQAGKPVANAEIFIQNFGAESGSSVWHYFARTGSEGRFAFTHLPPNRSFSLYATMESLAGQGAVSRRKGQVHADGSTSDFGDLNLDSAFAVEGRVRLSDGQPIPTNSRVRLTRTTKVGLQDG